MAYHHLNTLTIFPERLEHNLDILSHMHPGVRPVPVVKSNAYGHGIKIVAPYLQRYDVPFVCVDSLYEAYELEKNGYKKNILIMGYVDPRDIPRRKNFIYVVSSLDYAQALVHQYSRIRLHLFMDTGMHREGITSLDAVYAREVLTKIGTHIEGFMSHLSTPDNISVSNQQIDTFGQFRRVFAELNISPEYVHIGASGGLINAQRYMSSIGNIARTGLAYFGYGHPELLPSIRCTTTLIQIKQIQKGDAVGYDGTYIAEKPMKIGVLPIGYHDGLDRRLSNVGMVGIGHQICPIVGRVSMNLTTVDVTDVENVFEGQEVILMSEEPHSLLSLESQAESVAMISYDYLVHLNKEMYRMVSGAKK